METESTGGLFYANALPSYKNANASSGSVNLTLFSKRV